MGLLDSWRASERAETEGDKKVPPIALKDLIEKNDMNGKLFADVLRLGAEGGDSAAEDALTNILAKRYTAVDLSKLVEYHAAFTEHLQKAKKVEAFLASDTMKALGEHTKEFAQLNAIFGGEAGAKPHWDEQLLFLSIHDPHTFDSIHSSVDRYIDARKLTKAVAEKAVKYENLRGVTLDSIGNMESRKERRKFLREKISAERFGAWRQAIDKYTLGFLSRMSARAAERRVGTILEKENAGIARDQADIGEMLQDSVNTDPDIQLAFVEAARSGKSERGLAFKTVADLVDFDAAMLKAWQAARPPRFNPGHARAAAERTAFLAAWRPAHAGKLTALGGIWGAVGTGFFSAYTPDPAKLV